MIERERSPARETMVRDALIRYITALQNYRKAKALVVRVPQHGLAEARTVTISEHGRIGQIAMDDNPTRGSLRKAAMVSKVV